MSVKIAVAQLNCVVGDFAGNAAKIIEFSRQASKKGADIVVTPELSLAGYPPEDLLLRPCFIDTARVALTQLACDLAQFPGLHVLVGHPLHHEATRFNSCSVLCDGKILAQYCKQTLPNESVFDEKRYFTCAQSATVFSVNGINFGLAICEDTWNARVPLQVRKAGAHVLLVQNGSPYHMNKDSLRYQTMKKNVCAAGLSLVYANLVGGQDELVFDGHSFVMDQAGQIAAQLAQFKEDFQVIEFEGASPSPGLCAAPLTQEAQVYQALVLGVRDYVSKNGFSGAIIGLSGGVDSALTLAIAVDALGANQIRTVMMASPYTASISIEDARTMAESLGVRHEEIAIDNCFQAFKTSLAPAFEGRHEDTTEENIQARIRGTLLMALSNKFGEIVLTTGNKSEMAVGYCTLYGDMAGGFAVIKDIAKTLVYRLCEWRNNVGRIFPDRILTRAPSAELRDNQTDQDSLPPYEVLDAIMQRFIEENQSVSEIIAAGFNADDVNKITRLIKFNEYKRRQAPVGIRVTHRSFGRDWRYPITSAYKELGTTSIKENK